MKFRLSATVVFSAVIGYLLGAESLSLFAISYLIIGGILVTGSANAFNQILEQKHDKLMERTAQRPLPLGNLSSPQALVFATLIGGIGLLALYSVVPGGFKSCLFGVLSILLYVLVYTPLKRISPIAIFVGAFPGAIPILLGWVAATNDFSLVAGVLFAVQFCWQFPHFIAISWVQDAEYKKAGFKMMYGGKKGKYPALISIVASLFMTIISVIPFFWNYTDLTLSVYGASSVFVLGIWFTLKSVKLYNNTDDKSALKVMLSSFAYLPIMQIIYVLDKFLMQ
ncbi:MAG TPA: protoheme IX farnesyltransferase [Flavobacteriales bacterium]|jgi:protoheme IX farnesyltransferase|nr:protoheme IX farnesyltransferase [Flavobacteriales bacterium]HIL66887.1 protoheme IX farnesyltransferase [Flavobacteriales bacterium]